jgi:hypothetical protein
VLVAAAPRLRLRRAAARAAEPPRKAIEKEALVLDTAFATPLHIKNCRRQGKNPQNRLSHHVFHWYYSLLKLFAEVLHHGEKVAEYSEKRRPRRDQHH